VGLRAAACKHVHDKPALAAPITPALDNSWVSGICGKLADGRHACMHPVCCSGMTRHINHARIIGRITTLCS
jgi:hypothetical protein